MSAPRHQWTLAARVSILAALIAPLAGCAGYRDRADLGYGPVHHPDEGDHRQIFAHPVGATYPDLYVHPLPAILHESLQRDDRPAYPGLNLTPPAAPPPTAPSGASPATPPAAPATGAPRTNLWMRPSPPAAQQPALPQKNGALPQDAQKAAVLLPFDQRRPQRAPAASEQPTVTVVDEDASGPTRPTIAARRAGSQ